MQSHKPIKVLVVDDSSLMRSHICSVLIESGMITDTATNGQECLDKMLSFRPDVITLDINMPIMDGITCLKQIMANHPMPVVMISSLTQKNALETLDALDIGAVDYIAKPDGSISLSMNRSKYMLVSKVISASHSKVRVKREGLTYATGRPLMSATPLFTQTGQTVNSFAAVIIGVSTGGPTSLQEIIPKLPADYPYPIIVAQHMPSRFTAVFAARLDKISALSVEELSTPTILHAGCVYIAQGDANIEMFLQAGKLSARPNVDESSYIWRPSITMLVESALKVMPAKRLCCVQLTGMGNDGAQAMATAHSQGATTIAESEQTATVYGMPKELVKLGGASKVLPNYDIANALLSLR